ncbi:MAG: branched-chain amino acid transport system substrate-binding protein, partial [Abditibacteriota bacterium]|nr:branched-chain amino acid transport system substrate-binding protein [Abditibacteriota bacterium]
DLTGKTAQFGESTRDGVALAVEEANAAGGVLGKKIRIQLEDNNGLPQQTSQVVRKLVYQDNVLAVLGEVASSRSIAGAKVCQPAGMPMISPTSTNPEVTKIGNYIFRTCFIDPFQGTVCARFAKDHLKVKNAAVLTDVKNAYSVGLSKYFIEEFKRGGGQIVAEQNYKEGDENFRSQLAAIKTKNPQVIFIPG